MELHERWLPNSNVYLLRQNCSPEYYATLSVSVAVCIILTPMQISITARYYDISTYTLSLAIIRCMYSQPYNTVCCGKRVASRCKRILLWDDVDEFMQRITKLAQWNQSQTCIAIMAVVSLSANLNPEAIVCTTRGSATTAAAATELDCCMYCFRVGS